MALVQCPECQKTVSDVASVCPHCSFSLVSARRQRPEAGQTMLCHRCGVRIASGAPVCCNCGVLDPHPRRSFFRPGVLGIAAVATLAILTGGVFFDRDRGDAQPVVVATAANTPVVETPSAAPEPAAPALPEPQELESNPDSAPFLAQSASGGANLGPTVHLWTRTWANVREDRGTASEVVRILEPGVSIEVGDRQAHWWAVIEDGRRLGYVANSVLTSDPAEIAAPSLMSRGN